MFHCVDEQEGGGGGGEFSRVFYSICLLVRMLLEFNRINILLFSKIISSKFLYLQGRS